MEDYVIPAPTSTELRAEPLRGCAIDYHPLSQQEIDEAIRRYEEIRDGNRSRNE